MDNKEINSFKHPHTCCFFLVKIYFYLKNNNKEKCYKEIIQNLTTEDAMDLDKFKRRANVISNEFDRWNKHNSVEYRYFTDVFAHQNHTEEGHTLFDCSVCKEKHTATLCMRKMKYPPFIKAQSKLALDFSSKSNANKVVPNILPKTTIQKNIEKEAVLNAKRDLERHMALSSVKRTLGCGTSASKHRKASMLRTHESKDDARARTKKLKDHVGHAATKEIWKKDDFIAHLLTKNDGDKINWSATARQFGLLKENRGQIAEKYSLQFPEIQNKKFTKQEKRSGSPVVRRSKLRMIDNRFSVPCEPTPKVTKALLQKEIADGKINPGIAVVPRTIEKQVIDANGSLITKEKVSWSRTITLKELREQLLKEQAKYMRLTSDAVFSKMPQEEISTMYNNLPSGLDNTINPTHVEMVCALKNAQRNRHLTFWHDGSSLISHAYMLFTVQILYDPLVFYTNKEFCELKNLNKFDVQGRVEEPMIYILGQAKSSNEHQLQYVKIRMEDIAELKDTPLEEQGSKIKIFDHVRMFIGDGPARQFESGQSKGGTFPCVACPVLNNCRHKLKDTMVLPRISLEDKRKLIMKGNRANFDPSKSLMDLKKKDTFEEVKARQLLAQGDEGKGLLGLYKELLKGNLLGSFRLPALCTVNPMIEVKSLIGPYEVVACEPMHDLKGHIENLLLEMPYHVKKENSVIVSTLINNLLEHACSAFHYRKALLDLLLHKEISSLLGMKIYMILRTLAEMMAICYAKEEMRCSRQLLHYQLCAHQHAILLEEIVGYTPKLKSKLTHESFYGAYFHSIVDHVGEVLQVMSVASVYTENTERLFRK